MNPQVLGAMQPTNLSFSRALVRRMAEERWNIECTTLGLDQRGSGEACYRVDTGSQVFSLVVFAFEPLRDERTPRIIGKNWDMMCALLEGDADPERVEQTRRELPKLYAGRAASGTLTWCRANQSLRAFDHVVSRLASGRQPEIARLARVCYLMRNAGIDANGTFGTRSFLSYEPGSPLAEPYYAQLLSAYLMREFSFDAAEAAARHVNPAAVRLDPQIKRFLGLGNASGLGLVLWVNSHPRLVDHWLDLRETTLAEARTLAVTPTDVDRLLELLRRCIRYREEDRVDYSSLTSSATVAAELSGEVVPLVEELATRVSAGDPTDEGAFGALADELHGRVDAETAEALNGILIDLVTEKCPPAAGTLHASEVLTGDPTMTVAELRALIQEHYAWALSMDLDGPEAERYVWYKSADAEEPRRGPAEEVPPGFDLTLDLPRHVVRLDGLLAGEEGIDTAEFLLRHPEERAWVERIQGLAGHDYHSPHMDMRSERFLPIQIIRLVNSAFYGIDKTKDFKGRIVRGVLYHGAPTRSELASGEGADWHFPQEPR
jgi:hypothetical protein